MLKLNLPHNNVESLERIFLSYHEERLLIRGFSAIQMEKDKFLLRHKKDMQAARRGQSMHGTYWHMSHPSHTQPCGSQANSLRRLTQTYIVYGI